MGLFSPRYRDSGHDCESSALRNCAPYGPRHGPEEHVRVKPISGSRQRSSGCTSETTGPDETEDVIGAVDGTLVRIRTPAVDGWQYVSRKGTSCLNVCIIADAVGRILYVNSGSPGSVHDATVWRDSAPAAVFNCLARRLSPSWRYGVRQRRGGIITSFRFTAVQGRREENAI
ncbi:hypothetical protein OSTOST_09770 [Ostertagia ostertagi]